MTPLRNSRSQVSAANRTVHCSLPLVCVTCPLMAAEEQPPCSCLLFSTEDIVLGSSGPHCLLQPCLWQMAHVTVPCSRAAGPPHLCLMPCPAKSAEVFLATGKRESKERPREMRASWRTCWWAGKQQLQQEVALGSPSPSAGPAPLPSPGRLPVVQREVQVQREPPSQALRDSRLGHRDLGRGSMCACGGRGSTSVLGRNWDRAEGCGASLGCTAISAQVPGVSSFQLYPKFSWGPEWDQRKMEVSEGAFGKGKNSSKK